MMDQTVGREVGDRHVRVPERAADDWNACCSRGCDVDSRVANHDGPGCIASGEGDSAAQVIWVRFIHREGVTTGNAAEIPGEIQGVEKLLGQADALVRADREANAVLLEVVEGGEAAVEGTALGCNIVFIVSKKPGEEPVDFRIWSVATGGPQASRNHMAGPEADGGAQDGSWHGIKTEVSQGMVGGGDEIGRGIDESSVQIEGDGQLFHGGTFSHRASVCHEKAVKGGGSSLRSCCGIGDGRLRILLLDGTEGGKDARGDERRMAAESLKIAAAERALAYVEPRMRLGLGTGSTAARFVDLLGQEVKRGLNVICVPTSEATRLQAYKLGIPLTTLDETPLLDITIDGADELDGELRLIKGGGGALLREKIVATASDQMIVIADASKRVGTLGAFPLPVEVVRFGVTATRNMIEMLAADAGCRGEIKMRMGFDDQPFVTDGGNYIFDCAFGRIEDPEALDEALKFIPGVVENGLFLGIADAAIIGAPEGVSVLEARYGETADTAR